ncbi:MULTISPECIES: hypothetical protein [Paracoccus]|uniref:hypothetical protein n=1 Tax=Paracoccus TaxID=265 RepID=UPI00055B9E82|nr:MULTISPECIES: hypothetical protein [Paracoccus]MBT0781229.1 hypothetical protein [Paracoccus sp. pheM1]
MVLKEDAACFGGFDRLGQREDHWRVDLLGDQILDVVDLGLHVARRGQHEFELREGRFHRLIAFFAAVGAMLGIETTFWMAIIPPTELGLR